MLQRVRASKPVLQEPALPQRRRRSRTRRMQGSSGPAPFLHS